MIFCGVLAVHCKVAAFTPKKARGLKNICGTAENQDFIRNRRLFFHAIPRLIFQNRQPADKYSLIR